MAKQQPMKMAAAEAVFETKDGAGLSLFATGDFKSNPEGPNRNVQIPNLLSWISTGYPRGEIEGINDINREYRQVRPGRVRAGHRRRLLDVARDDRRRRCSCSWSAHTAGGRCAGDAWSTRGAS